MLKKQRRKEKIMKKLLRFGTVWFVVLYFVSTAFAGNVSVPPGYTYFRGIAWNSTVYDAAIKKAKEKGYNAICLTNLSSSDDKILFSIKNDYQISKVKGEISLVENDMVVSACKEVSIKRIKLIEGEYAIWKNGQLQKSSDKLPIKRE
jgi:hypothetical protein